MTDPILVLADISMLVIIIIALILVAIAICIKVTEWWKNNHPFPPTTALRNVQFTPYVEGDIRSEQDQMFVESEEHPPGSGDTMEVRITRIRSDGTSNTLHPLLLTTGDTFVLQNNTEPPRRSEFNNVIVASEFTQVHVEIVAPGIIHITAGTRPRIPGIEFDPAVTVKEPEPILVNEVSRFKRLTRPPDKEPMYEYYCRRCGGVYTADNMPPGLVCENHLTEPLYKRVRSD